MSAKRTNAGSLVVGAVLVAFGLLTLLGQVFASFDYWGTVWPLVIIVAGFMFFVGMFAGGRPLAGLAIPGTIITVIGLMLLLQNFFDYWESWSYGWTLIVMAVGLGILIMGWYTRDDGQRRSGLGVLKTGAVLFVIFGGFFEMIFNSFSFSKYLFPLAMIALGAYLILARSRLFGRRNDPFTDGPDSANQ
jgi:hypothetical protein